MARVSERKLRLKTVQAKRPDDCAIFAKSMPNRMRTQNDRLSEELMRAFRVISICYFISAFIYHHHHYYIHFHGNEPPPVTYISPLLHTYKQPRNRVVSLSLSLIIIHYYDYRLDD